MPNGHRSDSGDARAMNAVPNAPSELTAVHVSGDIGLDAANAASEWQSATPIRFSADWEGKNADRALETEVRVLWSRSTLFLRFVCHYRELFVFDDSDPNSRRDYLWDRDVAEAFLQPPDSFAKSEQVSSDAGFHKVEGEYDTPYASYKEFEVAPNGMW